jgi:hypothetical protein
MKITLPLNAPVNEITKNAALTRAGVLAFP